MLTHETLSGQLRQKPLRLGLYSLSQLQAPHAQSALDMRMQHRLAPLRHSRSTHPTPHSQPPPSPPVLQLRTSPQVQTKSKTSFSYTVSTQSYVCSIQIFTRTCRPRAAYHNHSNFCSPFHHQAHQHAPPSTFRPAPAQTDPRPPHRPSLGRD